MSSGEIGVAVLWKPLTYLLAGLWTILLGVLGYQFTKVDKKVDKLDESLDSHNNNLALNYYTKPQVEQYVQLTQEPLRQALITNADATNRLADKIEKILEKR